MRSATLLLVEDNPGDVGLVTSIVKDSEVPAELLVAKDGAQAIRLLRGVGVGASPRHTKPNLVLLDLNLPRKSGQDVLREIKADKQLRDIPVVVMTSSTRESDISACYRLGANCFVAKPMDLEEYEELVNAVIDFWLEKAVLPAN